MQLEFSDEELQALVRILDAAVRYGGIQIAPAVTHFSAKIEQAKQNTEELKKEGKKNGHVQRHNRNNGATENAVAHDS